MINFTGFAVVLFVLLINRKKGSLLWEIPMGLLALSIVTDIAGDDAIVVLRIIIPFAMLFTAYHSPQKLWLVFPICVLSLFLKNSFGVSMVWGALWYGGREIIAMRHIYIYNSTIKKQALQGNNFE